MIKILPNYKNKDGSYNWDIFEKMGYYDPELKKTILPRDEYDTKEEDEYWEEYFKNKMEN